MAQANLGKRQPAAIGSYKFEALKVDISAKAEIKRGR